MKLLEEFNKVKAENKKCIVFIKSGVFYISLGIDAYILNHILKLKLTDMSNTKRVGIPINSIEKYISKYNDFSNMITFDEKYTEIGGITTKMKEQMKQSIQGKIGLVK